MFCAYILTNTVNGKKYVGITSSVKTRKSWHLQIARADACDHRRQAVHKAIRKYGEKNFSFEIIACAPTWDDLLALEQQLIKQENSFATGGHGYNMTLGGQGTLGHTHLVSEETRKRMSARRKGRKLTPEWIESLRATFTPERRKRSSETLSGRKLSPEHAAKARVAFLGKRHSDESRAVMSEKVKASANTPEAKERTRRVHTGRKNSEATRAKMRAAKQTPEAKARCSEAAKQRWQAPETREKMLAAARKAAETRRGTKVSDATRAKLSAIRRGQKKSEEHIAKIAAANRGKKHSAEARAKMSAARKARNNRVSIQQGELTV